VVALTLVGNDDDGERATVQAARTWRKRYGLRSAFVAADPLHVFARDNTLTTPLLVVIDPRTMRIVNRSEGWGGRHPRALFDLARKNQRKN
jgi:hypothetical protein